MEPNGSSPHSQNTTNRPNPNKLIQFTLSQHHWPRSIYRTEFHVSHQTFKLKNYLTPNALHTETNKLNTPAERCVNCCLKLLQKRLLVTSKFHFDKRKTKARNICSCCGLCTALMYTGCESVKCNALWRCKDSMKPSGPKPVDNLQNALT
jgi:hypothetical protein